jgi:two-component system chemotaxis response regulator CheB
MKMLKAAGARTLAQSEETCVVYGMPKAAVELGVVDRQLSLENLPQAVLQELDRHARPPVLSAVVKTAGAESILYS